MWMTLEQQGRELCRSTYIWFFFPNKYRLQYSTIHGWIHGCRATIWKASSKVICGFPLQGGWSPSPNIVQGQLRLALPISMFHILDTLLPPIYIKDLSVPEFWYSWGFWNQFPSDTEGWLYMLQLPYLQKENNNGAFLREFESKDSMKYIRCAFNSASST